MAKITLRGSAFNSVTNPSDGIQLIEAGAFSHPTAVPGTMVRGAGGRVRLITHAGTNRSWSLTFPMVSATQVRWLEDHVGELVIARHRRGQKIIGTYLEVKVTEETGYGDPATVDLTLTELTFTEAV